MTATQFSICLDMYHNWNEMYRLLPEHVKAQFMSRLLDKA